MSKKWNRVLSFLLALALVITTFGSDIASVKSYAGEIEDQHIEAEVDAPADTVADDADAAEGTEEPKSFDDIKEEVEGTAPSTNDEVASNASAEEEQPADEGSANATVVEDEKKAEAPADTAKAEAPAESAQAEAPAESVKAEAPAESVKAETPAAADDADAADKDAKAEVKADEKTEAKADEKVEAKADEKADAKADGKVKKAAKADGLEEEELEEEELEEEEIEIELVDTTLEATCNGINITVSGPMPEGAVLEVEAIDNDDDIAAEIENMVDADEVETYTFDIKIASDLVEGGYYQPIDFEKSLSVTFSDIKAGADEDTDLAVYHVTDEDVIVPMASTEGEEEEVNTDTKIEIETDHFSVYTVTIIRKDYGEAPVTVNAEIYLYDTNFKEIGSPVSYVREKPVKGDWKVNVSELKQHTGLDVSKFRGAYYVTSDAKFVRVLRMLTNFASLGIIDLNLPVDTFMIPVESISVTETGEVYCYFLPSLVFLQLPPGKLSEGKLVFVYEAEQVTTTVNINYHSENAEKAFPDSATFTGASTLYTVKTLDETGFTAPEYYEFKGWSTIEGADTPNVGKTYIVNSTDTTINFYAVYNEKLVQSSDHVDVGFTESDFRKVLEDVNNNPRKVTVKVYKDGKEYPTTYIGQDKQNKAYEYRLNLSCYGLTVTEKDELTFTVKVGTNPETSHTTNRAENLKAYEFCGRGGFDYLYEYSKTFATATVLYHKANKNAEPTRDLKNWQNADSIRYEVKANTEKYEGYEFLGWATDELDYSEGKSYDESKVVYIPGSDDENKSGFTLEKGTTVDLYPVYKKIVQNVKITYHAEKGNPSFEEYNVPKDQEYTILSYKDALGVDLPEGKELVHWIAISKSSCQQGIGFGFGFSFSAGGEVNFAGMQLGASAEIDFGVLFNLLGRKSGQYSYTTYQPGETYDASKDLVLWAVLRDKEPDEYNVAVYVSAGTKQQIADVEDALGLDYIQPDGFYPIGVVTLDKKYFNGKDTSLDADKWNSIKADIKKSGIDTTHNGGNNTANKVVDNLDLAFTDFGVENSGKTALFWWDKPETDSMQLINGKFYKYHLDIQYNVNTVSYVGVYPASANKANVDLGQRTYLTNTKVTVPDGNVIDPTKIDVGYKIANPGYFVNASCQDEYAAEVDDPITSDKTVYVKLVPDTVTVTYHTCFGTDVSSSATVSKGSYSIKQYSSVFGSNTKPGATFAGWFDSADEDGNEYVDANITLTEDTDFYAHWDDIPYTITYVDENGVTIPAEGNPKTQKYGELTWTLAEDPSKTNYQFDGWLKEGDTSNTVYTTAQLKTTPVTGDATYKAKYTQVAFKAYYKVRYFYADRNGDFDENVYEESDAIDKVVDKDGEFVFLTEADLNRDKNGKYVLVEALSDMDGKLLTSAYDTKEKALVLNVYYDRLHSGLVMYVVAPSDGKDYDGLPLNTKDIDPIVSIVDGNNKEVDLGYEIISYTYTGERTDAGFAYNEIKTFEIKVDGVTYTETTDLSDAKYDITKITTGRGELWVNPITVALTVPGATKSYDGKIYDAAEYKKPIDKVDTKLYEDTVIEMDNLRVVIDAIKDVKASEAKNNEITVKYDGVRVNGNLVNAADFVDDNIKVTVVPGDLVIEPAEVTMKSADLEKPFDGTALVNGNTPLVVNKGWADGEGATPVFTGEQIKIGSSLNTFGLVFDKNTDETNYAFKDAAGNDLITFGSLTVTPPDQKYKVIATLHADGEGSGSEKYVKYNGEEQSVSMIVKLHIESEEVQEETQTAKAFFSTLANSLASLFTIKASAATAVQEEVEFNGTTFYVSGITVDGGNGIHVDNYDVNIDYTNMKIEVKDKNGNLIDVTDDLLGKTTDGSKTERIGGLHITPRYVTLVSDGASKTYDGTALTNPSFNAYEKDGEVAFVAGDDVRVTFTGSLVGSATETQTAENTFTYEVTNETMLKDYVINTQFGILTVNPAPVAADVVDDTPSTPSTPSNADDTVYVAAPAAPVASVLGAQRELPADNQGAVLGARRGRTDDPTNNAARIIIIVIAAGVAASIMILGRKKEDSEE